MLKFSIMRLSHLTTKIDCTKKLYKREFTDDIR